MLPLAGCKRGCTKTVSRLGSEYSDRCKVKMLFSSRAKCLVPPFPFQRDIMSSTDPPPPSPGKSVDPPPLLANIKLTPLISEKSPQTNSIENGEGVKIVLQPKPSSVKEMGSIGERLDMTEQLAPLVEERKEVNSEGKDGREANVPFMDAEESSSMSPSRLQINLDEDQPSAASSAEFVEKIDQSESSSADMAPFLEPEVVLAEKVNGTPVNVDTSKEDDIEVLQEKPAEIPRLKVKRDLMYTEEEIQQNHADAQGESGESLQKRPKLGNESLAAILSRPLVNLDKPSEIQHPSLVTANDMIQKLQKDIKTLHFMAKQKEKEWNYILRLKKMKEEMEVKLRRQREIIHFSMQPVEQDLVNLPMPNINENFVRNHSDQNLRHINGMLPPNPPQGMQVQGMGNLPSVSPPTMSPMNLQGIKLEGYRREMPILTQPPQMMSHNQQSHNQQSHNQQSHNQQMQNKAPPQYKPQPMVQIPASAALGLASRSNSQSPGPVPPTPPSQNAANSAITALLNSRLQKQRPILPKPQELQNLGNMQWNEELTDPRNRVGPTVNVQRIIDDYRSKHPDDTSLSRPARRGGKFVPPSYPMQQNVPGLHKRISSNTSSASISGGNMEIGGGVTVNHGGEKVSLENFLQQRIKESPAGVNFKDLLLQFAKLSQTGQQSQSQNENIDLSKVAAALSNSDITLQPILPGMKGQTQKKHSPDATPPQETSSSSILHGALSGTIARGEISVKPTGSSYTPTLASLLTSSNEPDQPEVLTLSNLLNTTKETALSPSDSSNGAGPSTSSESSKKDDQEVPKCQGCNSKAAQFVCAGCGSQWYCSRECQVDAWEDHSDNCVG